MPDSVSAKFQRAVVARARMQSAQTNTLRLIDGRGDGFDGVDIDDFAGHWLVQTRDDHFPEWVNAIGTPKPPGSETLFRNPLVRQTPFASPPPLQSNCKDKGVPKWSLGTRAFEDARPQSIYWKIRDGKKSPQWMSGEKISAPFPVLENGIQYWIDFAAGYSQGLFLDQRENRLAVRNLSRGKIILNTFAYTCAFGVSAALGGGRTVNLDLSKKYLDWGKRNYELNSVDPAAHEFLFGDVLDWLPRFEKKSRRFDLILLDPPTFSRDARGKVFTIQSSYGSLISLAEKLLSPRGAILCCTNQRTLNERAFLELLKTNLIKTHNWNFRSTPMPPDFTGEQYLKTIWIE